MRSHVLTIGQHFAECLVIDRNCLIMHIQGLGTLCLLHRMWAQRWIQPMSILSFMSCYVTLLLLSWASTVFPSNRTALFVISQYQQVSSTTRYCYRQKLVPRYYRVTGQHLFLGQQTVLRVDQYKLERLKPGNVHM